MIPEVVATLTDRGTGAVFIRRLPVEPGDETWARMIRDPRYDVIVATDLPMNARTLAEVDFVMSEWSSMNDMEKGAMTKLVDSGHPACENMARYVRSKYAELVRLPSDRARLFNALVERARASYWEDFERYCVENPQARTVALAAVDTDLERCLSESWLGMLDAVQQGRCRLFESEPPESVALALGRLAEFNEYPIADIDQRLSRIGCYRVGCGTICVLSAASDSGESEQPTA